MKDRVDLTSETGVSILSLRIQKHIGWIIRNVRNTDVGIDATLEQVIDGDPKAKYISVQLKTGFGNVYTNANGDFTFYFGEVHYRYWLSSSIPIIFVLCDPDTEMLYWEQITQRTITKTPKEYSLRIKKESILDKNSLPKLEDLISLYQKNDVLLDQLDEMDAEEKFEYCRDLLSSCKESISVITDEILKYDVAINKGIKESEDFITVNKAQGWTKEEAKKHIKSICRKRTLAMNICTTRINREYSITLDTHIEALRLFDDLVKSLPNNSEFQPIIEFIQKVLIDDANQIESTISTCKKVYDQFSNDSDNISIELKRSQYRFSVIISDYAANLEVLVTLIHNSVKKLVELNE